MAKKRKRTPAEIKTDIDLLKSSKTDVQIQIDEKVDEAILEIRDSILNLIDYLGGQAVPGGSFEIVKLAKSKRWVFEVSFPESEMLSRPSVAKAIAEIDDYVSAASVKSPIKEEFL